MPLEKPSRIGFSSKTFSLSLVNSTPDFQCVLFQKFTITTVPQRSQVIGVKYIFRVETRGELILFQSTRFQPAPYLLCVPRPNARRRLAHQNYETSNSEIDTMKNGAALNIIELECLINRLPNTGEYTGLSMELNRQAFIIRTCRHLK